MFPDFRFLFLFLFRFAPFLQSLIYPLLSPHIVNILALALTSSRLISLIIPSNVAGPISFVHLRISSAVSLLTIPPVDITTALNIPE